MKHQGSETDYDYAIVFTMSKRWNYFPSKLQVSSNGRKKYIRCKIKVLAVSKSGVLKAKQETIKVLLCQRFKADSLFLFTIPDTKRRRLLSVFVQSTVEMEVKVYEIYTNSGIPTVYRPKCNRVFIMTLVVIILTTILTNIKKNW